MNTEKPDICPSCGLDQMSGEYRLVELDGNTFVDPFTVIAVKAAPFDTCYVFVGVEEPLKVDGVGREVAGKIRKALQVRGY